MKHNLRRGFTLVELLVVIGIIAILFAVVLVAIDPAKRLSQSRNTTRQQDVNNILEAVQEFVVDNSGIFPASTTLSTTYKMLGTCSSVSSISCGTPTGTTTLTACVDMTSALVPTYLASMPYDPTVGSASTSYYAIAKTSAGRVIVSACLPELGASISVQR